jgi:hypothetical protein
MRYEYIQERRLGKIHTINKLRKQTLSLKDGYERRSPRGRRFSTGRYVCRASDIVYF